MRMDVVLVLLAVGLFAYNIEPAVLLGVGSVIIVVLGVAAWMYSCTQGLAAALAGTVWIPVFTVLALAIYSLIFAGLGAV